MGRKNIKVRNIYEGAVFFFDWTYVPPFKEALQRFHHQEDCPSDQLLNFIGGNYYVSSGWMPLDTNEATGIHYGYRFFAIRCYHCHAFEEFLRPHYQH